MSIELDWQIIDDDAPQPDKPRPFKQRGRLPRKRLVGLVLTLILAVAAAGVYVQWNYYRQLGLVAEPVQRVAKLEAQAVASDDLTTFLALQDPDDSTWRALQEQRFRRLERIGLPELGWQATGVEPQLGSVSLEPGGARLDVEYQFAVTQPVPGGSTSITLRLPQFYDQTPLGWVHTMPGADFWGPLRRRAGKRFAIWYFQPDADVLEPLVPRMDAVLQRVCSFLSCPPQPILVVFDNSAETLARFDSFSYGFDDDAFTLKLPSPHLIGLPADVPSRNELYRAIGTRVLQALVYASSERHIDLKYVPLQTILQWELAQAGLAGPSYSQALTHTLASAIDSGQDLALASIPLRKSVTQANSGELGSQATLPLALSFLKDQLGAGSVWRVVREMDTVETMGDDIKQALRVNPATLEPTWQRYLRSAAGLPALGEAAPDVPTGILALRCLNDKGKSSIWLVNTDGTGLAQISADDQDAWMPIWSPDNKRLAYSQESRTMVMDVESRQIKTVSNEQEKYLVGWMPDGRLQVANNAGVELIDLDADRHTIISDTYRVWSVDAKQMAYITYVSGVTDPLTGGYTPTVWVADSSGQNARVIGTGIQLAWSPDGRQLAILDGLTESSSSNRRPFYPQELRLADTASGAERTLVRVYDLQPDGRINGLAWSPDSSMLAVAIDPPLEIPAVYVLSADTGKVYARQNDTKVLRFDDPTWSPDGRHLAVWATDPTREDTLVVLDVQTGQSVELLVNRFSWPSNKLFEVISSNRFDWSPDGRWLAVTMDPNGVMLVTMDMEAMHWLNTPSCKGIAWRPAH